MQIKSKRLVLKMFSLILVGFLVLFVLKAGSFFYANAQAVTPGLYFRLISPQETLGISNDSQIQIGVYVTPTTNVYASEVRINFNKNILRADSISEDNSVLALYKNIDNNAGTITADVVNSGSGNFLDSTNLLVITFTVLNANVQNTTISFDATSTLGLPDVLTNYSNIVLLFRSPSLNSKKIGEIVSSGKACSICGKLDKNNDSQVNHIEFAEFSMYYKKVCSGANTVDRCNNCAKWDTDGNGIVNGIDFGNFVKAYLGVCNSNI